MKYTKKFQYLKKIIIYIFDFECNFCEVPSFNLDVHHIDKNNQNDDPLNLVPLCKDCHKIVHKNVGYYQTKMTNIQLKLLRKLSLTFRLFKNENS